MSTFLDIDLTGYKDRFGSYITPGRYHVVVDDTEMDRSRAGNPMVNIWLRIVSGADGTPTEHDGQTQTDRLTITEKALFRVVGFLTALNGKAPERKNLRVNPDRWKGRHLLVDIREGDPYNGRRKSEVEGYLRFSGATGAEAAADLDDVEDTPVTAPADAVAPWEEQGEEEPTAPADVPDSRPAEDETPAQVKAPANPQTVALDDIDL